MAARDDDARRAGAEPLRRRRARADRGADRQSLPRRRDRRCAAPRGDDARGRAARTDGAACAARCASSTSTAGPGRMLADAGRWRLRARIEARVAPLQPG
ncbi:MAG: hypothetical protein MZW92_70365 [Comamonadaceae bacterium]|nr:hypothetical protein [Comamonadaceae bacterium]